MSVTMMISMLVVVLAILAVSGCTTGSMNVTPTATPKAAPTIAPTTVPAAPVTATPAATAIPQVTPSSSSGPYPTMPPWTGEAPTYTPTPVTGYYLISSPWVDQKIEVGDGPVVLTVNGNVGTKLSLTMKGLKSLGVRHVNVSSSGSKLIYVDADAVSLNALLDRAGAKGTNVKFIGSDGFSQTIPLSAILPQPDAVIAFTSSDGLRNCVPGQSAKMWVKNLVTIEVI